MGKKQETTATKTAFEFWIEREQKSRLDKLSQETGAPMAEICRRAIRAYLEKVAVH
jgi:predicted DNA-binding protein